MEDSISSTIRLCPESSLHPLLEQITDFGQQFFLSGWFGRCFLDRLLRPPPSLEAGCSHALP